MNLGFSDITRLLFSEKWMLTAVTLLSFNGIMRGTNWRSCPFYTESLLCNYTPKTFGNLRGYIKSCKLILADSGRPIRFPYAWLHRRRNWSERAVVFTSGVMDWVIVCRPRMAPLWKGPLCSDPRLQLPRTTERYFTSVLWTGPSALTPYPEPFFLWASSYSTSSTGSPIKCFDTRTSMQICKRLFANPSCYIFGVFFFSQNQNCLSDLHYNEEMCQEAYMYMLLKTIAKNFVLRCVFRISAVWVRAGVVCDCPLVSVLVRFVDVIATETKHRWYLWVYDVWDESSGWIRHTDLNFDTTHLWMNVFEKLKR